MLKRKYSGLNELLDAEQDAKSYFTKLPDYVKEHIRTREQNVNSFDSLKDYAENLLRGDC